jgi:hypothetical protein
MGNPTEKLQRTKRPIFAWQHIIALLGVVVVLPGLALAYFQIPRARLDITIGERTPLFSWRYDAGPKFKLLVDDRPIESASIVGVELANSGTIDLIPIVPETPEHEQNAKITLTVSEGCELLRADWDQSFGDPSTLLTSLETNAHSATFLIKLMNKGARARFYVYVANCDQVRPVQCVGKGKGMNARVVPTGRDGWRAGWAGLIPLCLAFAATTLIIWFIRACAHRFNPSFQFFAKDVDKSFVAAMRNFLLLALIFAIFLGAVSVFETMVDFAYKEFLL